MAKYLISVMAVLAVAGLAFSQSKTPTQTDFDACNSEAKTKLGVPAASPATGGTATTPKPTVPDSPGAAPGTGATAAPQVSAAEAGLLQGIAEAGRKDPAYQKAYVQCMRQRGF
jgi:hypothetical protein